MTDMIQTVADAGASTGYVTSTENSANAGAMMATADNLASAATGFVSGFVTMIGGFIMFYGLYLIFCCIRYHRTDLWARAIRMILVGAVILILRILFLS